MQKAWSISVQFSGSLMSNSLWPHGPQHARPPCPSPTPRVYSNSCPLSQWCHSTISSSVVPFSSWLQSCPASGSFQMSQFFTSSGQSNGASASASVFPRHIQYWSPLGLTGWSTSIPRQRRCSTSLPRQRRCSSSLPRQWQVFQLSSTHSEILEIMVST